MADYIDATTQPHPQQSAIFQPDQEQEYTHPSSPNLLHNLPQQDQKNEQEQEQEIQYPITHNKLLSLKYLQAKSTEQPVQSVPKKAMEIQMQTDGSGKHGTEHATWSDQFLRQFWYGAATAAESIGYVNAARHMRHYLNNHGDKLYVNAGLMERDIPSFHRQVAREVGIAKNNANQKILADYKGSPIQFTLVGERKLGYAKQDECPDWFYAVGGFTYWYTAEVNVRPSPNSKDKVPPQVEMKFTIHVFDRYNWDEGKSVTIAGVTITDKMMGHLHKAGIAYEYEVLIFIN